MGNFLTMSKLLIVAVLCLYIQVAESTACSFPSPPYASTVTYNTLGLCSAATSVNFDVTQMTSSPTMFASITLVSFAATQGFTLSGWASSGIVPTVTSLTVSVSGITGAGSNFIKLTGFFPANLFLTVTSCTLSIGVAAPTPCNTYATPLCMSIQPVGAATISIGGNTLTSTGTSSLTASGIVVTSPSATLSFSSVSLSFAGSSLTASTPGNLDAAGIIFLSNTVITGSTILFSGITVTGVSNGIASTTTTHSGFVLGGSLTLTATSLFSIVSCTYLISGTVASINAASFQLLRGKGTILVDTSIMSLTTITLSTIGATITQINTGAAATPASISGVVHFAGAATTFTNAGFTMTGVTVTMLKTMVRPRQSRRPGHLRRSRRP